MIVFLHTRGAIPNHILPSRSTVVVGARRLTCCAGVVVAHIASTGVAIITVRKNNTIWGFLCVTRRSVASKIHVGLYCVWLVLHLSPHFLPSGVCLVVLIAASSISCTLSVSLLLLHLHEIHHGLLDGERMYYLCYAVGAL